MTFGYDACILGGRSKVSTNRLNAHAKDLVNDLASIRSNSAAERRPIIFVAHSLGGIVCKDALYMSSISAESHLRAISEFTFAIAFMGTPHNGSILANWAKIPAKSLDLLHQANTTLLSILETDSEVLGRVQDDFLSLIRRREHGNHPIKVTCLFESLPMPVVGKVVPADSAILPGYTSISVHADHREMVRFADEDDPAFQKVVCELERWSREAQNAPQVDELDKKKVLDSLAFPQMGLRQASIGQPMQATCEWIFQSSQFQDWASNKKLDQSNGIIWIKGKPGSGKSTIMKKLYEVRRNLAGAGNPAGPPLLLEFFFNARGGVLERTPLGLFRSLVYQILVACPALLSRFTQKLKSSTRSFAHDTLALTLQELQSFFHESLTLSSHFEIEIFLDALDECLDDEVRDIVRSFSTSASYAVSVGHPLKICWSSRHYPHITVEKCFEVTMEAQNAPDIAAYIHQELASLKHLKPRSELESLMIQRSAGVFLWAVIATRKLIKATEQGRPDPFLISLVTELPRELDQLFSSIMATIDPSLKAETDMVVRWVLFANQPLSVSGMQTILAHEFEDHAQTWDFVQTASGSELVPDLKDLQLDRFRNYITEISGGLLEISAPQADCRFDRTGLGCGSVTSSSRRHFFSRPFWQHRQCVVQVIHESVREFLLSRKEGREEILFLEKTYAQLCHESLYQSCARWIQKPIFRYATNARLRLPNDADMWLGAHFTHYVLENLYVHAEKSGVYDDAKMDRDKSSSSKMLFSRWMAVGEIACQGFRSSFGIKSSFAKDLLLRHELLTREEIFSISQCAKGSHEGLLTWLQDGHSSISDRARECTFVAAAHHDLVEEIQEMLSTGVAPTSRDLDGCTALHQACARMNSYLPCFLLRQGLPVNAINSLAQTPLHYAANAGSADLVPLLIAHGADPNITDQAGYTPLHDAIFSNRLEFANRLIEGRADLNAPRLEKLQKPLHVATTCRNRTAVELLLEKGADVDAVNGSGLTPLIIASRRNDIELVCLFLDRGADVNKSSDRGWTPLYYAATEGNYAVTSLLIKHGARDMRSRKVTQRLSRKSSYSNLNQVSVSPSFDSTREIHMTPEQTVELKVAERFVRRIIRLSSEGELSRLMDST
jgi:ankyrin repeat protein